MLTREEKAEIIRLTDDMMLAATHDLKILLSALMPGAPEEPPAPRLPIAMRAMKSYIENIS